MIVEVCLGQPTTGRGLIGAWGALVGCVVGELVVPSSLPSLTCFGLALLLPALPFLLDELGFSETQVPVWNGIITTSQFAAIILGNLVWGAVSDRYGSQRSLACAMIGDTLFFALTAAAPFGLRGTPAGVMLVAVRAGAGFCTPLVSALVFIFDRAGSPRELVKGLGDYGVCCPHSNAAGVSPNEPISRMCPFACRWQSFRPTPWEPWLLGRCTKPWDGDGQIAYLWLSLDLPRSMSSCSVRLQ